jgi:predicted transcriptional regulator
MANTFSIYIEDDLLKQIEEAAKKDDRPVSAMARVLIREALKARETNN